MSVLWNSADLRAATGGTLNADVQVTGISIDTRTLTPGDLFIALRGETSDGHAHVQQALDKGASCALVHDTAGLDDPRLLIVPDTMTALVDLGRNARAFSRKSRRHHRKCRQDDDQGHAESRAVRHRPDARCGRLLQQSLGVP